MPFEILAFPGSTLTTLIIAMLAIIGLAIFRAVIPLIIGIIVIAILVVWFGGIPIPR